MEEVEIKTLLKNHQDIVESMDDFMNRLYVDERDQRVGLKVQDAGEFSLTFNDLLPQRYYTVCAYLETQYNAITNAVCVSEDTQGWGTIMKASAVFDNTLAAEDLNKILCYFTKQTDTEVVYLTDLEGNSCHDRAVKNLYYSYNGEVFSKESDLTYVYLITNPDIASDPSPTAFLNMYGSDRQLTATSLASAISNFSINYLTSKYISSTSAINMISRSNANGI